MSELVFEPKFKSLNRAQKNAMNYMAFEDHKGPRANWQTLQSLGRLGLLEFLYPNRWNMPNHVFQEWVKFTADKAQAQINQAQ